MNDRALHFVALVGSGHEASVADAIANTLDELAPDDVQVSVLPSVGDLPRFNDDLAEPNVPSAVTVLGNDVAVADGVVIVTLEFNRSVPGALKDALDWLARLPARPLAGKPVAIQTASHCAFGGILIQPHLRQILLSMDALVLSAPEVTVPDASLKVDRSTGGLNNAQARREIAAQLAAFAAFSRCRWERFPASDAGAPSPR